MTINLAQPFVPLLERLAEQDETAKQTVEIYLPKVRKTLRGYAAKMHKSSLDGIMLLDVVSDDMGVSPGLLKFIDGRPEIKHKSPVKSHFRKLLEVVFGTPDLGGVPVEAGFIESSLPDWMRPVWPHLAMDEGRLTTPSRHLLGLLLYVVAAYSPTSLRQLMVELAEELSEAVRVIYDSPAWKQMYFHLSKLRCALKLAEPRCGRVRSLPFEEWPPTLRKQWTEFEGLALLGPNQSLIKMAKKHKLKVLKLGASSLHNYREAVARALRIMPWKNDLRLEDLLRVTEVEAEGGGRQKRWINELVEVYRLDQQKASDKKSEGSDTTTFVSFICALKAMASYFGLFAEKQDFHAGYNPRSDKETRDRKRQVKKAAYTQDFIDGEIEKLNKKFRRIIETGSYATNAKDLRLCVFFVAFLTMRFMGFRQQAIRNCKLHENIIFGSRGKSITFQWPTWLVKTKRPILIELERGTDKTHELMIDVLFLYKEHVYPLIEKKQAYDLGGQFFVRLGRGSRQFVSFKGHSNFWEWFSTASLEFLPLKGKVPGRKEGMHPHFLRGFASDWLRKYGLSAEDIADLMSISERTLKEYYFSKDLPVNTRSSLNNLQMKRMEKEALQGGGLQLELVAGQLAGKILEAIDKQSSIGGGRRRSGPSRRGTAKLELDVTALLEQEVAELKKQNAELLRQQSSPGT